MNRRALSSRSAAAKRAQAAKAERDRERRERETKIEAALTDYFQATAEAERIRSAARRKAEHLTAGAERAVAGPAAAARDAVRRLKDLLGGTAEVARLCGLPVTAVREILTSAAPAPDGGPGPSGGGGDDGA